MRRAARPVWRALLASACVVAGAQAAEEERAAPTLGATAPAEETAVRPVTIACSSKPGERQDCPADTSRGVVLARSTGEAPCLLGKSWGYGDRSIWVSDGCSAEFVVGQSVQEAAETAEARKKPLEYIPNIGFRLVEGGK